MQTGGIEHALDRPARGVEVVVASDGLAGFAPVKQRSQPHRVDEVDTAQVEHEFVGSRGACLLESVFENLRRTYIQLPAQSQQMPLVLDRVVMRR